MFLRVTKNTGHLSLFLVGYLGMYYWAEINSLTLHTEQASTTNNLAPKAKAKLTALHH